MELNYKQFTLEIKSLQEDGSFEGYVAAFGNIDFGNDIFDSKAFSDEPAGTFYPLLADHDANKPIGKFRIEPDDYGLKMVDAKLNLMRDPVTQNYLVPNAAEKYANLKNGDISGFSVGYGVDRKDCEMKTVDNKVCRLINKARFMEGSVVTFPMNDKARLTAIKSMLKDVHLDEEDRTEIKEILNPEKEDKNFNESASLKDIETILKDSGFSSKEAKTLISKVKEFSKKDQCDVDLEESIKVLRDTTAKIALNNAVTSLKSGINFN